MNQRFYWLSLVAFLILSIHTVFSAPLITSLTPFIGPSSGGTVVMITGSGFTGATAVNFGEIPAAAFMVNSDTSMTATSPPHSPQVIFVTVTAPSGTSPLSSDAYFVYQGNGEAYVANSGSNSVSVINTTNNAVVGIPIAVGTTPMAIGITPDGTKAFVVNQDTNNVSVIDTASHTNIATIPVGSSPVGIAITPDGAEAYVTNQGSNTVSVIDITNNAFVVNIPVGATPIPIAITPDGTKAYVANYDDDNVSVIDTVSHTVAPMTIPVGDRPFTIVITPDGTKVFVTNLAGDSVSIIRTLDDLVTSLMAGDQPAGIAIQPDGTHAYVTNQVDDTVSVIDVLSNTLVLTIPLGLNKSPLGIAITPDGMTAYVANVNDDSISVINTATNTLQTTIPPIGNNPIYIAITPDGTKAYVARSVGNTISVINTADNSVGAPVIVEQTPGVITIAADQAPLAKFTFTIATADSPSSFDASASASPIGTIVNYFWDFGDGNTINTATPITFHTYAVPGNYIVTLVVTNSIGTSNTQIFNPAGASLFSGIGEVFNSMTIIKNGGPSALSTQMITVFPPTPPTPAPIITAINPGSSSTCGGIAVTISGANFTGATAVLFGSTPATSFIVNSDTTITAIAPPGASGTVDIRVVTSGGISATTPADQFTYLLPSPPKHLRGRHVVKTKCPLQPNIINILTWKAPSKACPPFAYRIFVIKR